MNKHDLSAREDATPCEPTAQDIFGCLEIACWTTLALLPLLLYVNGPSVSRDQFVVRCSIVAVAAVGATVFTLRRWYRASKRKGEYIK